MKKNNCLEHLRKYKLEHQVWFNDIHKRLNLLLVDKKRVKFESLAKVASRWIIPVSSDLKSLQGINEIQKLILIEVQVYKKIIELINKPLKGSLFESKNKNIQKRDNILIMHAEAMATAYSNIVESFNNLEKELITTKKQCVDTTASSAKTKLKNNKKTTAKKGSFKNQTHSKKEDLAKSTTIDTSENIKSNISDKKQKTSLQKTASKVVVKNSIKSKEKTAVTDNNISMENMLNQSLLDSLNQNRKTNKRKETEVKEIFNLQEEIKKIVG